MKIKIFGFIILLLYTLGGCKRAEFLDKKPASNLIVPETLSDFRQLLDNYSVMTQSSVILPQMASDEYTITYPFWQALTLPAERNSYIWASDIYNGDKGIYDWDRAFSAIFYANNVLEGLTKSKDAGTSEGLFLKGCALFYRAYAFYDLTRNYGKAYDAATAGNDLGIPLRLKPGIDYIEKRATLQQSFDQILSDLLGAENLLPIARPSENLTRPSRIAVYALLARIYLDMRNYVQAENYADKCLALYSDLTDYTTISKTSLTPFSTVNNDELIYISSTGASYSEVIGAGSQFSPRIDKTLIDLYKTSDLRLELYYTKLADGTYCKKRGYAGDVTVFYPFFGLATDEVYLIKAECLARRGNITAAMDKLNQLLVKRFPTSQVYVPLTSNSASDALAKVLLERRKELVWRGLRWFDLKRLNKEGANITLSRSLNGVTYTLPPNDLRWVFPIYPEEISLSGIEQNPR